MGSRGDDRFRARDGRGPGVKVALTLPPAKKCQRPVAEVRATCEHVKQHQTTRGKTGRLSPEAWEHGFRIRYGSSTAWLPFIRNM